MEIWISNTWLQPLNTEKVYETPARFCCWKNEFSPEKKKKTAFSYRNTEVETSSVKEVLRRRHQRIRGKSSRNITKDEWGENNKMCKTTKTLRLAKQNSCKATPLNLSKCWKIFLTGPLDVDLCSHREASGRAALSPPWTHPFISPHRGMSIIFFLLNEAINN